MSSFLSIIKQLAKRVVANPKCPDFLIFFIWSHSSGRQPPPPPVVKQRIVKEYASRYKIKTLVETGTFRGDMVYAMRKHMDRIYSIELSDEYFRKAAERFKRYDHITIIHGDSSQELLKLLPSLDKPCIFWLDAHYCKQMTGRGTKDTPIVSELQFILDARDQRDVILIDDARDFVGQKDYPRMDELRKMILDKRPGAHFEVSDDIIRIHE